MLLNEDKVYYIDTYSNGLPSITVQTDRSYSSNRNCQDRDYWLIQFTNKNSFKVYPIDLLVPSNILEKIRKGEVTLILDNAYEYFYEVVESVYEDVINKFNIPHNQVILVSGNYDLANRVKEYAQKNGQPEVLVDYFNFYEWATYNHYMDFRQKYIPVLQKTEYPKRFLCLNRRWRPHRSLLLTLLYERNLIDKGHVSFKRGPDNPPWENARHSMLHKYAMYPEIIKIINYISPAVKSILPLDLDSVELDPHHADPMMLVPSMDPFYMDTIYSLVTESTVDRKTEGRFLTEKIFKPIALRHPFIVCGPDRTLEALRNIGYKTFDGIIDESYDLEEDEAKRIVMIVNEVERISKLEGDDLKNFINRCKDISFINYVTFRNRDRHNRFEYVHKMNYE